MEQKIIRDGRNAYMIITGGVHAVPYVLTRRVDLKRSKWSAGNVTPTMRARALELVNAL